MKKVTSREWNRKPDSHKSISNGQRSMVFYDVRLGTYTEPVEIDDENGLECAEYLFEDFGIPLRVYAYTIEDAMAYAVQDGHPRHRIENMRRVRSLCDPE